MNHKEGIDNTVDAILEQPIKITIHVDNPTWKHKLRFVPKSQTFILKPLVCGSILRISKIIESMELEREGFNDKVLMEVGVDQVVRNMDKMIEVVAIAMMNSETRPSKSLMRYLMENTKPSEIFNIVRIIIKQMDVMGFMTSIILIKGMSLFKAEEIIASGEQSEAQ